MFNKDIQVNKASLYKYLEKGSSWELNKRILFGKEIARLLLNENQAFSADPLKACYFITTICNEKSLYLFEKSYSSWYQPLASNFHSKETRDICIYTMCKLVIESHQTFNESKKLVTFWVAKLSPTIVNSLILEKSVITKSTSYKRIFSFSPLSIILFLFC